LLCSNTNFNGAEFTVKLSAFRDGPRVSSTHAQPQPTAHTMMWMNNQLILLEKSLEEIKMLMHKEFSFIAQLQDFYFSSYRKKLTL
jgi:hypothetical protein